MKYLKGILTEQQLVNTIISPQKIYEFGMFNTQDDFTNFHCIMMDLLEKYRSINDLLFEIVKQNFRNTEKMLEDCTPKYMLMYKKLIVEDEISVLDSYTKLKGQINYEDEDIGIIFKHKHVKGYMLVDVNSRTINLIGEVSEDYDEIVRLVNVEEKFMLEEFYLSEGKFSSLKARLVDSLNNPMEV